VEAKKKRKSISSKNPFYFSYKETTVCDGIPLGFTFDASEWKRARDIIKSNSKTYYAPLEGEQMPRTRLPTKERLKSRHYNLHDVFKGAPLVNAEINELDWYYDLTKWDEYCKLLTDEHHKDLERPRGFTTGHLYTGEKK